MSVDKQWLTTGEVASRLEVSRETVRRWCTLGQVWIVGETMRTGRGHWRVSAAAVERYLRTYGPGV